MGVKIANMTYHGILSPELGLSVLSDALSMALLVGNLSLVGITSA
jgi:hypothetical protein